MSQEAERDGQQERGRETGWILFPIVYSIGRRRHCRPLSPLWPPGSLNRPH